jgi:carboxyl-terminal processing protease
MRNSMKRQRTMGSSCSLDQVVCVFFLCLGVFGNGLLPAAETAGPRTLAVLVGVNETGDPAVTPRPAAVQDAIGFYDQLVDPQVGAADPKNVHLLLSQDDPKRPHRPATRDEIVRALAQVAQQAGKDDLVIVAFFGRGAPTGDRTCLFVKGSTVKDRKQNALLPTDIEQAVKGLKSERVAVFIDIDFTGVRLDAESAPEPNVVDFATVFNGHEDADEGLLPLGRAAFIASSGGVAPHLDTAENGLFMAVVLEGFKGQADTDGYEPDGVVTVDELRTYLETKVIERARQLGKTKAEKEQSPLVWTTRSAHYVLSRNPTVYPKNVERVARLRSLGLPAELVEEGTRYIQRMPKLKIQQELRKKYVALADGSLTVEAFQAQRDELIRGMQLDREAALAFARKTLSGLELIRRSYIRPLEWRDLADWSVRGLFRGLEETLPPELMERLTSTDKVSPSSLSDLLVEARLLLGKREDLDKHRDVDVTLRSVIAHLDPHSMYISEEEILQLQSRLLGQFTGIGINVRRDLVRDGLLVISPIRNSPAHRAGIKTGDLITEIIREVDSRGQPLNPPEVISTKGMRTDEAVKKIQGQPRTKVKIRVLREGHDQPLEFEMNRERIDIETVLGVRRLPDDSWDFWLDPQARLAYIRLTEFAPKSFSDLQAVVKKLKAEKLRGLVLDLRFNPGGALTSAVQITELFLDDGLVVTIKPRPGVDEEVAYTVRRKAPERLGSDVPLVVLINGQSASASEIVAAALQDHDRAMICGERSFGKGSVQSIIDFPAAKAKIKLTTATFWRPNGKNLHKAATSGKENEDWGVTPDPGFLIPLTRDERIALAEKLRDLEIIPNPALPQERKPSVPDRQLDAALRYLRAQVGESRKSAASSDRDS